MLSLLPRHDVPEVKDGVYKTRFPWGAAAPANIHTLLQPWFKLQVPGCSKQVWISLQVALGISFPSEMR